MNTLKVGPLTVTLHRTIRVHPDDKSNLPPSLGHLPIYNVADYRAGCPESWEDNAVFVALHPQEALWLSFSTSEPVAVLLGAGGVNALNGEKLGLTLDKDNYMVTPPQPWLDGWKDQDGTVYQFVGTEYKKGEGLTVGEQLHKQECKTGGMGIAIFEAKDPASLRAKVGTPKEWSYGGILDPESFCPPDGGSIMQFAAGSANLDMFYSDQDEDCCYAACCDFDSGESQVKSLCEAPSSPRKSRAQEMGVGKGGKIHQKVYPDPYGIETWKSEPSAAVAVYLVNSKDFSEITGLPMPPLPKAAADYYGRWYGLHDHHLEDVKGTEKFTDLKNVFHTEPEENVAAAK